MLVELVSKELPDSRGSSGDPDVLIEIVGFGNSSSDEGDDGVEKQKSRGKVEHDENKDKMI